MFLPPSLPEFGRKKCSSLRKESCTEIGNWVDPSAVLIRFG